MPCCTLTAFLLSQLGLAGGAVKARFFGGWDPSRMVPQGLLAMVRRWRWAGFAAALGIEVLLAGAAAPYIVTEHGRAQAASSFSSAWHICSVVVSHASR